MPFGATPSRWCVYQFHHLGEYSVVSRATHFDTGGGRRGVLAQRTQSRQALEQSYFGAAAGAGGTGGTAVPEGGATGAA
jgi:hypothetical protein